MIYTVILLPEARAQLIELDAHIAVAASPEIAARYTDAIMDFFAFHCAFFRNVEPAATISGSVCASRPIANAP